MTHADDSVLDLVKEIRRRAPEYLDLITSTTAKDFDTAFDALLDKAVQHLEANKTKFAGLDEEGLTAVIVASLSIPGLSVIQEAHSNGHVDLTIEADHCVPKRRKLGEAKIYDGPVYHVKGMGQLLERYSTGRECRGLLIVYVRKPEIAKLVGKLRDHLDSQKPLHQVGATQTHGLQWSFLSSHAHSSGEQLDVCHIGCNLYVV